MLRSSGRLRRFMLANSTVISKTCHPSYVFIHVISAHHMHDFTNIFLLMFILKSSFEGLVCLRKEHICLIILVTWRESFVSSWMPWFISIELGRIFILSQIHSERNFIFGQLATTPDQVIVIRRITDEVNVGVCRCVHWLSALSASLYLLEFWASGLDLTTGVLCFRNTCIVVCWSEVVISGQNRSSLLWIVLLLEQLTVFDCLAKPLLLFLQVGLIEAGRVIDQLWLLLLLGGIYVTKRAH